MPLRVLATTHRRLYNLRSGPTGRGWVAGTRPAMTAMMREPDITGSRA